MKASETKLQPVLEGEKQYVIPLFQRHYSWKKEHWKTLWDDLTELYESSDGREHFLGAIVTMPIDMQPHGVSKYVLIDGQQRLTTLFVLLAAMRDLATKNDKKLAAQINEQYLINKWADGQNRLKLFPTQTDRQAFYQIMNGSINGQLHLVQAYRFFTKQLQGRDETGQPYDFKRIHNLLVQQFMIVSIVLAKDENPYLIFESLNAKGQPLTQADLVRNYLLMRIDDEEDQILAYKDLWHPIEVELGDQLTNFLWRYLTKDGTFVRQGSIYEAIKNNLSNLPTSNEVIDVLMDMRIYAGYYKRLIEPDNEPDPQIRRRLHRINRWEINTAYPFLLALYHDYDQGELTSTEMCQILDAIESYVIRRFFCRVPTNALNRIFIALYKSLTEDKVESTRSHLLARRWPSDEEFLNGWIRFPIYNSGTAKCRHILESLEESLTHNNEPVDVTHPRITIEHVMPQTLNEEWELHLGSNAAQIHDLYQHTIGNLTLTGKNEPMGNSSFVDKKPVFVGSNFALNDFVAAQEKWDDTNIQQRAVQLCQNAFEIWWRPQAIEITAQEDDPTGHKPTRFILFGEIYTAQTWREVLLKTVEKLIKQHGAENFMNRVTNVAGSKRQYVAYAQDDMANPAPIPNSSIWVETNLSSRSILSVIMQLIVACGHDESEFQAFWD
ncbi:MAG: DUF262 domain-containing protein [Anaerolineales bacterium]|nr:DUF262 domain-containing protein [Anaerolineales bacterium]